LLIAHYSLLICERRLAYAADFCVCFDICFLGASPLRGVGLSAPIYFAALRKFRFNPLRLAYAPASGFYIHGVLLCRDGSRFIPKINAVEQLALFAPRYFLPFT
jgi:hypothetical protein